MASGPIRGLYVIIEPEACAGRSPAAVARLALAGGAAIVQWRDKVRPLGDQLADAEAVRQACTEHGATFIVNDRVDLALVMKAAGVHLGQRDLPLEAARRLLPPPSIIGVSTNNAEEARRAADQ